MSSEQNPAADDSLESLREEFAEAFDRDTDPLRKYSTQFDELPDPFEYFVATVLPNRGAITSQDTIDNYQRTYRQWRDHMATTDRHPACPSPYHVKSFIEWQRDVASNTRATIQSKLNCLTQAYEFFQEESIFPHPADYNPFKMGRKMTSLGEYNDKDFHDPSLTELRGIFDDIENIRSRGIIGTQLKLGLRASELCNLQLQDLHLSHSALQDVYPSLGTNPKLREYTDVLFVPPDRDGNKSEVPRLVPIDGELRWLLIQHLITRPQVDEPWVFLSRRSFTQMSLKGVNRPWQEAFRPQYGETDTHKAISSHFGRHWFSSYVRLEMGLEREKVQYMRGDRIQPLDDFPDAIDEYLHPNYEQIEQVYRDEIFKLNIPMQHYSW